MHGWGFLLTPTFQSYGLAGISLPQVLKSSIFATFTLPHFRSLISIHWLSFFWNCSSPWILAHQLYHEPIWSPSTPRILTPLHQFHHGAPPPEASWKTWSSWTYLNVIPFLLLLELWDLVEWSVYQWWIDSGCFGCFFCCDNTAQVLFIVLLSHEKLVFDSRRKHEKHIPILVNHKFPSIYFQNHSHFG